MINANIGAMDIRNASRELKDLDKTLLTGLRRDLRSTISPFAQQVAAAFPSEAPLSGMNNSGGTGWTAVKPSVSFTPGTSRKTGNHLVSLRINPVGKQRGIYIGEFAGSRSGGKTARGRSLINKLNERYPMKGKGGRFGYTKFRLLRPDVVNLAVVIVNRVIAKVNRSIEI
jgi:hypothetical protein